MTFASGIVPSTAFVSSLLRWIPSAHCHFYGANSCSFRSQSFHFVTLSPRLIRGEIVTLRHCPKFSLRFKRRAFYALVFVHPCLVSERKNYRIYLVSRVEEFARPGIRIGIFNLFSSLTNFDSYYQRFEWHS